MRDTESSPRGSHAGREREREEGRNALYIQRGHDLFIRERERGEERERERERLGWGSERVSAGSQIMQHALSARPFPLSTRRREKQSVENLLLLLDVISGLSLFLAKCRQERSIFRTAERRVFLYIPSWPKELFERFTLRHPNYGRHAGSTSHAIVWPGG